MDRDTEYLRDRIDYLERMLEHCLAHIRSLEARLADLERRPVLVVAAEEAPERAKEVRAQLAEEWAEVLEGSQHFRFLTERHGELLFQFFPELKRPKVRRG